MKPSTRAKSPGKRSRSERHARHEQQRIPVGRRRSNRHARPAVAYRQRGRCGQNNSEPFNAPERWHEPEGGPIRFVVEPAGRGYRHPVTVAEVRERLQKLPKKYTQGIEVVQFSRMTKKRALFPCYGMQWGPNIYLYPIEESLVETYYEPPRPEQLIEAEMFGGQWKQQGEFWRLIWSAESIRDFYLNNVLIHEVGHVNDERNRSFTDRERFANWFATEYGFRASRGRR